MYTDFFNLQSRPFTISPDPRYLYMSDRHQEALAHLLYGLNDGGGFVALTGEVGTGKTTLCYHVLNQLPDNVELALILNPRVSAVELLATLCDELGVQYPSETTSVKKLVDCLNKHLLAVHASGRKTVVMIDEAQNLSFDVLEQIRLLTNLETSETKLLQMILVGQPELNQMLEKENLRQLLQRITARYHLQALSFSETQHYIEHRLHISGARTDIFEPAAIKVLYKKSRGIPRLINSICDRAMMGAYGLGQRKVTKKVMAQAIKEVFPVFEGLKKGHNKLGLMVWAIMLFLIVLMIPLWINFSSDKGSETSGLAAQQGKADPDLTAVIAKKSIKSDGEKTSPNPIAKQEVETKQFEDFLRDHASNEAKAISLLQTVWKLQPQEKTCQRLGSNEVGCFDFSGNWQSFLAFNRPAVMVFVNQQGRTVHAVLAAVNDGRPQFISANGQKLEFDLGDVLMWWQGQAYVLWHKPVNDLPISIANNNESVGWLRQQMDSIDGVFSNVDYPNLFDDDLLVRVKEFQQAHGLYQDGVVGGKTIVHLNNIDASLDVPRLEQ